MQAANFMFLSDLKKYLSMTNGKFHSFVEIYENIENQNRLHLTVTSRCFSYGKGCKSGCTAVEAAGRI